MYIYRALKRSLFCSFRAQRIPSPNINTPRIQITQITPWPKNPDPVPVPIQTSTERGGWEGGSEDWAAEPACYKKDGLVFRTNDKNPPPLVLKTLKGFLYKGGRGEGGGALIFQLSFGSPPDTSPNM